MIVIFIDWLAGLTALPPTDLLICLGFVFLAGLVRGFSGFALSAVVMAGAVIILPPVELIPVTYCLEATASLLMFRGGMKNANMKIVGGLLIGAVIGVPIGLLATTSFPIETSKLVALCLIITLAIAQLLRFAPKFLDTKPGLYGAGLIAGIATGLASIGGMVVALYVLASNTTPKVMRASLVMFLFANMLTSLIFLFAYGILTPLSLTRGLVFAPVVALGVVLGSALFRPSLEVFYKRFCLSLLIGLSVVGLLNFI